MPKEPMQREIKEKIRRLICRIFGHSSVESVMASIVRTALNKPVFPIRCKRCGENLNSK